MRFGSQWPGGTRPNKSTNGDEWLITYADSITLLMAFFVMMFSVSNLNYEKFSEIKASIDQALGHRTPAKREQVEAPSSKTPTIQLEKTPKRTISAIPETEVRPDPFHAQLSALETTLSRLDKTKMVDVSRRPDSFHIELASSSLYEVGSSDIRKTMRPVLREIANTLTQMNLTLFDVDVEGHTDDIAISNSRFPSNWELSAARATNVVRFLVKHGVAQSRIKASAYSDTRPKLPPFGADGRPNVSNRAKNRRVVIRVDPVRPLAVEPKN